MANAYNVCGWVKRVTATMGIPAIFLHDEGAKWGGDGCFLGSVDKYRGELKQKHIKTVFWRKTKLGRNVILRKH